MTSDCNPILDLVVTIDITEDLTSDSGFSIQLNAYPASGESRHGKQQSSSPCKSMVTVPQASRRTSTSGASSRRWVSSPSEIHSRCACSRALHCQRAITCQSRSGINGSTPTAAASGRLLLSRCVTCSVPRPAATPLLPLTVTHRPARRCRVVPGMNWLRFSPSLSRSPARSSRRGSVRSPPALEPSLNSRSCNAVVISRLAATVHRRHQCHPAEIANSAYALMPLGASTSVAQAFTAHLSSDTPWIE